MTAQPLHQQYTEAFERLARAGVAAYRMQHGGIAVLSHICFKFSNLNIYNTSLAEAETLGTVTRTQHRGREIGWCKLDNPLLDNPLLAGSIRLEWLEFVQPVKDPSPVSGVASIGYCVKDLEDTTKIQSADPDIIFRYQAKSAADMAAQ